mmetsp:Transcript_171187/g.548765  ORF Transcript_171187/g.548765 Transcript_171187/m.548765 type:complete len:155 (+) Transcript_171187:465-929(+)
MALATFDLQHICLSPAYCRTPPELSTWACARSIRLYLPPQNIRTERGELLDCWPARLQMAVWLFIVTCMKISMVALMQAMPVLVYTANGALACFEYNAKVKLFVVMICVPLMMNTFQFVLTDNFIKKKKGVGATSDSRGLQDKDALLLQHEMRP